MKRRRKPPAKRPVRGQSHAVESWVRAAHFAARGLFLLLHALEAQQLPNWARQYRRATKAADAFTNASRWARISLHFPLDGRIPDPRRERKGKN
jgi:hypothetical protein